MSRVLILISTFNGGEKIIKQIDSILAQKEVDIYIYIRDDGSEKRTIEILKSIAIKYKNRVIVSYGKNKGWKQSFLELVYKVEDSYDYYGFADQDDIWFENKVINCINIVEGDEEIGAKLVHCNSISVTSDLKKRNEQEKRIAKPISFKSAIATEYFQGCGMLWNKEAMQILKRYRPRDKNLSHDYWVGLVIYLFGKVYFCETPQFYHIRYKSNSSEDGNRRGGRIKRFKTLLFGSNAYMNPANDILRGYYDLLKDNQKEFLEKLVYYKTNLSLKIKLVLDRDFRRPSLSATLLMKIAIFINKY